jgi:hypothetical protein
LGGCSVAAAAVTLDSSVAALLLALSELISFLSLASFPNVPNLLNVP